VRHDDLIFVAGVVGFRGRIVFDATRSEGTPVKVLDVSRMRGLGWSAGIDFRQGLAETYAWFLENQSRFRG
jgi:GDP-L-fucose synthase